MTLCLIVHILIPVKDVNFLKLNKEIIDSEQKVLFFIIITLKFHLQKMKDYKRERKFK